MQRQPNRLHERKKDSMLTKKEIRKAVLTERSALDEETVAQIGRAHV